MNSATSIVGLVLAVAIGAATLNPEPVLSEESKPKPTPLNCDIGPIDKTFGMTKWLVYSCDDHRSVILVSAPGSPAMPFVFFFIYGKDGYRLSGEGNGKKEATGAAFDELKLLTDQDIVALIEQTKRN